MPLKKALLVAFAAAAIVGGAGCSQRQPAEPTTVDNAPSDYKGDMQAALTGFFGTLKLTKEDIKPGLTVMWQSKDNLRTNGTLTATGETSPKGCPVWRVVEHLHWHDDAGTRSTGRTIAFCP